VLIGYARTSTLDQKAGLEAQLQELRRVGCEKLFQEQTSSVGKRTQLDAALDYIRDGDTLVITKLDRLARSVRHLMETMQRLKEKGAELRILSLNVDTSTATGKLTFTLIGAVAEFEREMMLERQREGIAKAKAAGKYKGRKPTARAKAGEVRELRDRGLGASAIAKQLGIGRASVYRCLGEAQGSGIAASIAG
jgi:DNA invertase Pin-like site-specific DNA recombinase